jgi:CTP:molybdopterin cytidylyltransferase MocA
MGKPKALVEDWLPRSVAVLRDGGCAAVTVVLGAAAEQARALVPDGADVVVAADWADGMATSFVTGLSACAHLEEAGPRRAEAALVHLVDLPDVGADVVRRVLAAAPVAPETLVRATYAGVPGHPVLLGRAHWPGILATATGDQGARDYLRSHEILAVECGDLATGRDVDAPG